jgi:hypothetical protein
MAGQKTWLKYTNGTVLTYKDGSQVEILGPGELIAYSDTPHYKVRVLTGPHKGTITHVFEKELR